LQQACALAEASACQARDVGTRVVERPKAEALEMAVKGMPYHAVAAELGAAEHVPQATGRGTTSQLQRSGLALTQCRCCHVRPCPGIVVVADQAVIAHAAEVTLASVLASQLASYNASPDVDSAY
jgi:hypothetical protein